MGVGWSRSDLAYQAEHIVTTLTNNAGFNCNAGYYCRARRAAKSFRSWHVWRPIQSHGGYQVFSGRRLWDEHDSRCMWEVGLIVQAVRPTFHIQLLGKNRKR